MEGAAYVARVSRPLVPISTGVEPLLPTLEGITTVIFDIYGTLLISAAGDIGLPGKDEAGRLGMVEVSEFFGRVFEGAEELIASDFVTLLESRLSKKRAAGLQFPEVDVRIVWKEIFEKHAPELAESSGDVAALRYECAMNPVWEMPGAGELIESLRRRRIKLGIISNAQDYTHSVFAGVMGGDFDALGFDPELRVFSYLQGEGKPSLVLYREMNKHLLAKGVKPESVLYIGNDMTKDVIPAAEVGFRTCLFAGDERSLRLGGLSESEAREIADAVVTKMSQISKLLK